MTDKQLINIRPWIKQDHEYISNGLDKWFWPYEPLSIGFRIKTPSPFEKYLYNSLPEDQNVSVVATLPQGEEDKIVGFLINSPNHPGIIKDIQDKIIENNIVDDIRFNALFGIMLDLNRMVDIFDRYNVEKTFHLVAVAVNPNNRGQNIGCKLFENSFILARNLGYKYVTVDCTSLFSTNIAKHLNMEPICEIIYKNYKDSEGNQIFTPPEIHKQMTRFIKKL